MRALLALLLALCAGQGIDLSSTPQPLKQYIAYAAEAQTIAAGRRAWLELHFAVNPGFHVNSHTPKSDLLIPTHVDLEPQDAVKVEAIEYPAGKPYSLSIDPGEKLDVYQDGFTVRVPVIASAGSHELKGVLTYQACDKAMCYPPRKLPVDVVFTAK